MADRTHKQTDRVQCIKGPTKERDKTESECELLLALCDCWAYCYSVQDAGFMQLTDNHFYRF